MFQSQARPPLPCHLVMGREKRFVSWVSISGETTAPLPRRYRSPSIPASPVSISGETTAPLPRRAVGSSWPPVREFQSQARPPLPCHLDAWCIRLGNRLVSISGETTAPL